MRRVLSSIAVVFCVLGVLQAGQDENDAAARRAGASAIEPKSTGTDKPAPPPTSRSAKVKGKPDATEYSYKIWPPRTQLGAFSADTEYGRILCTSFGTRSCRWE